MTAAIVGTLVLSAGVARAQGFTSPNQLRQEHLSDVWNEILSKAKKACVGIVTTRVAPNAAPAEQQKDIEDCALVLTLHAMGLLPDPKG